MTVRWVLMLLISLGWLSGCSDSTEEQAGTVEETVSPTAEVAEDARLSAEIAWEKAADLAEAARLKAQAAIDAGTSGAEAFEIARIEANAAMNAAVKAWADAQQFAGDQLEELRADAAIAYDRASEVWQSIYSGEEHEH